MVQVELHDGDAAAAHREAVLRVWEEVFGAVEDVVHWRETVWERHRARSGFRLATAHAGADLVGFGWGYTGAAGQFWSDLVLERLGDAVADWVGGHFELVELAVRPEARRQRTRTWLHDTLLAGLPHRRALLGTSDDPADPAVRLYRGRGWLPLGRHAPGQQVMGKVLDHPADACADQPRQGTPAGPPQGVTGAA